ncbi:MAG: cupin domain-containing protein [Nanoarchaeota archaeon]
MKIEVKKPTEEEKQEASSWGIWEKEVSEFPWEYTKKENCYILDGEAEVTCESGEKVSFKKGDYVVFPKGMKCTWKIKKPIKKHYRFV